MGRTGWGRILGSCASLGSAGSWGPIRGRLTDGKTGRSLAAGTGLSGRPPARLVKTAKFLFGFGCTAMFTSGTLLFGNFRFTLGSCGSVSSLLLNTIKVSGLFSTGLLIVGKLGLCGWVTGKLTGAVLLTLSCFVTKLFARDRGRRAGDIILFLIVGPGTLCGRGVGENLLDSRLI